LRARGLKMFRVLGVAAEQDIGAKCSRCITDLGLNSSARDGGGIAIFADSFLESGALHHLCVGKGSAKQHERDQDTKSRGQLPANRKARTIFNHVYTPRNQAGSQFLPLEFCTLKPQSK